MLSSIDVKFIFDSACLSESLGDKELFSSANIFQNSRGRQSSCLFVMFLANSSSISSSRNEGKVPPFYKLSLDSGLLG